jgi:hypothetical protein
LFGCAGLQQQLTWDDEEEENDPFPKKPVSDVDTIADQTSYLEMSPSSKEVDVTQQEQGKDEDEQRRLLTDTLPLKPPPLPVKTAPKRDYLLPIVATSVI